MGRKTVTKRQEKNQSVLVIAVFLAAILIGGTVFAALVGGNSGGGARTGGSSQSASGYENEVQTLTQQVYANPDDVNAKERLGTAYFNLANQYKESNDPRATVTFAEAIRYYKDVIAVKPNSKESLGDLATAQFYTGEVDAAIDTVQKALKVDPGFTPARINYAIYLGYGKGDYANAIKQLELIPSGTTQYSQAQGLLEEFRKSSNGK